jgi:hypothetical protein|tara:strand:+ start:3112 stop:3234 length:123 start_codon:yes stop_codon:yes gene_type:complete
MLFAIHAFAEVLGISVCKKKWEEKERTGILVPIIRHPEFG